MADVHDTAGSRGVVSGTARGSRGGPVGLVRDRLTARLLDPSEYRVGLVVAPAGSGKSRLLSHVAGSYQGPVAWCDTPDPVPRSEASFVSWLWEGMRTTGLDQEGDAPADLDALLAMAPGGDTPLVVVLDDVHLLEGGEAEVSLESLVTRLPVSWRLILASRITLSVDLSRLRVSGQVVDIGPDELRFRTWEVEELFRDVYGEPLLPEDVAALTRRTAGWAAYLQMFFLATSRRPLAERRMVLGTLQHRTRLVSEYLGRHVLSGLDPELQDFLIRTSVLRRPSGHLADEFLGWAEGSSAHLAELERRQLFTERLADDSFRYHAVLLSHLDGMLVENVGLVAAQAEHRRAGGLLEREGLHEEALAAYARSEDWPGMARVLDLLGADRARLDDSWAEALPPGVLGSDPLLLMAQARTALSRGALGEAAGILRRAETVAASASVARQCRLQREQILAWAEPDRPLGTDWIGVIRAATRRQPQEARRAAASLPGPTGRFAEASSALIAGDAVSCARIMRAVLGHPDVPAAVGVVAGFISAACGVLTGRVVPSEALDRLREEVEACGIRWLSRIVRAGLTGPGPAGDDALDDLLGACEREDDRWGTAAITAIDGFRRLMRGDPDAEAVLARAADASGELGAGAVEASLAGYAALAARAGGRADQVAGHAGRARALGTALDVPLAVALAELVLSGPLDRGGSEVEEVAAGRQVLERFGSWEWHAARLDRPAGLASSVASSSAGSPAPLVEALSLGATPPARLCCLGEYVLEIGAARVDDAGAKPMERSLLHLLSIRAGSPIHRESLVASLWPDADPEAGLHRLQVAVSSLRRLIGATGADGNEILVRAGDAYRLTLPGGAWVDVAQFEGAVTRADAARAARDSAGERAALDEALSLYSGPLLPGDGPAEWVVEPRRWLNGRFTDAAARLAGLSLEEDDPRSAMRTARAGLAADRYRDDLWKLLIEAAEQAGNHAEAEQARRDYESVLADLGV